MKGQTCRICIICRMQWANQTLAIGLNLVVFWSCKFSVGFFCSPLESYIQITFPSFFRPWIQGKRDIAKYHKRSVQNNHQLLAVFPKKPSREVTYPPWGRVIHLHPPPGWQVLGNDGFIPSRASRRTSLDQSRSAARCTAWKWNGTPGFFGILCTQKKTTNNSCHKSGIPGQTDLFFLFFLKLFTYGQLLI